MNVIVQFVQRRVPLEGQRNQPINEVGITSQLLIPLPGT